MWVRLLDVPAALEARRYEVPVQVVLDVHDPYLERGGRFLLDGGPDGATCRRTDQEPDVSLGIDVLGAAYLGGARLGPTRSPDGSTSHTERCGRRPRSGHAHVPRPVGDHRLLSAGSDAEGVDLDAGSRLRGGG